MGVEDLEQYESEIELALYWGVPRRRAAVPVRRRDRAPLYLANDADVRVKATDGGEVFFEVALTDAWVWDIYRQSRFVKRVKVLTFKDVNVEELDPGALEPPEPPADVGGAA